MKTVAAEATRTIPATFKNLTRDVERRLALFESVKEQSAADRPEMPAPFRMCGSKRQWTNGGAP